MSPQLVIKNIKNDPEKLENGLMHSFLLKTISNFFMYFGFQSILFAELLLKKKKKYKE